MTFISSTTHKYPFCFIEERAIDLRGKIISKKQLTTNSRFVLEGTLLIEAMVQQAMTVTNGERWLLSAIERAEWASVPVGETITFETMLRKQRATVRQYDVIARDERQDEVASCRFTLMKVE